MKALMIATEKLPVPPIRGGAIQTYIANVASRLAKGGFDMTVLGVSDPDLASDERRDGVRFVRVPAGTLARYQESVVEFLSKERFDRIHLFNRPRLVLPVAGAAPNTPLSLSLHNEMFLPQKIDPTEARQAIAAVDRIATVSDFIGKGISDPYPEAGSKLRTIYSGVDAGEFVPGSTAQGRSMREALRNQHGLNGKQVVLFVGRLSPKKGADILLRAMELVAKELPSVALVLVGSKWYGADEMTDFVTYLQHLGARASVPIVTTGFISPDQVNQWFAAGDLFVCPSVWQEPLARVHYEAMAAGLPIITTRRGGNPEVVEGTGVGVVIDDPESPEAMAEAILGLLKSSSRREAMGQAGRRLAMERFSWDRVAQELAGLWADGQAAVASESESTVPVLAERSPAVPESSARPVATGRESIRPAERVASSAERTTALTRAATERRSERTAATERAPERTRAAEKVLDPTAAADKASETTRTEEAPVGEQRTEPITAVPEPSDSAKRTEAATGRSKTKEASQSKDEGKERRMIGRDLYQMGESVWVSKRFWPGARGLSRGGGVAGEPDPSPDSGRSHARPRCARGPDPVEGAGFLLGGC